MPTIRYQIRSEYGLADPELYAAADRDDPEAILEGVAMAGLVGVLRQLGDLAEFAAEMFHELHEEVMSTAARGHGLMLRIQQLEAEFPSIEKAIFSQSNHSIFACNDGIDWHANIQMDQNLVTQGDMPRFILDSYEECRGPPRLFMLDKFDIAGAGACLKRYSDPSFFKIDLSFSGLEEVNIQKEKKPRKIKKKGSRWKIGQTLESLLSPQADLSLQPTTSDHVKGKPATRAVRLKPRRLRHIDRSLIERLLELHSDVQKVMFNNSKSHLNGKVLPVDYTEPEMHDIIIDKSANTLFLGEKDIASLPERGGTRLEKLEMEYQKRENDIPGLQHQHTCEPQETDKSLHLTELEEILAGSNTKTGSFVDEYELSDLEKTAAFQMDQELVDTEAKQEGSGNEYRSDDISSEQETFSDALNSIESEVETDYESKNKPDADVINKKINEMDANVDENFDDLLGKISEPCYSDSNTNLNLQSAVKNERLTWLNSDAYSTMSKTRTAQEVLVIHADTESHLGANERNSELCSSIETSNSVRMDSSEPWKIKMFTDPILRSELGSPHMNDSFLEEPQPAEHVLELMKEDTAESNDMSASHPPATNESLSIEDSSHKDLATPMTMSPIREMQEPIKQDIGVHIDERSILPDMSSLSGKISPAAIHPGGVADMQNDLQPKESSDISSDDVAVNSLSRDFHGLSCGNDNEHVSENLHTEWHSVDLIPEDIAIGVSEELSFHASLGEPSPEIPPTTLDTVDFLKNHEGLIEDNGKATADEYLSGSEKIDEMANNSIEEPQDFDQEKHLSLTGELEIPTVTLETSDVPGWGNSLLEKRGSTNHGENLFYHTSVVGIEDPEEMAKTEAKEAQDFDEEESFPAFTDDIPVWHDSLAEEKKNGIDPDDVSSMVSLEETIELAKNIIEESQKIDQGKNLSSIQEFEIPSLTLNVDSVPVCHDSMEDERRNAVAVDDILYCRPEVSLESTYELAKTKNKTPHMPPEHIDFSDVEELYKLNEMESVELQHSLPETIIFLDNKQPHNHSYSSESIDSAEPFADIVKHGDESTGCILEGKEEIQRNLFMNKFSPISVVPDKLVGISPSSCSPEISYHQGQLEDDHDPIFVAQDELHIHEIIPLKIASPDTDVIDDNFSSVEEPSSDHAVSKHVLLGKELSDKDGTDMHQPFSPFKIPSLYIADAKDDTCSVEESSLDHAGPTYGCLSEVPSDKDGPDIHEQNSPLKIASLDIMDALGDTFSVEEPSLDHAAPKYGLLTEELSNKDAGLSTDLDCTQPKLEYSVGQTSPECSAEKEEATRPKALLPDPCDKENGELLLSTYAISNALTEHESTHLKFQVNGKENLLSSTEMDENLETNILSKAVEPNTDYHDSGSNIKLSELHSSSSNIDMPGELKLETLALHGNGSEHFASCLPESLESDFAFNERRFQLSHTKEVDELSTSFFSQDISESPPLPPLPPLEWRIGKFGEKTLLSDENSTQHQIGTSLSPSTAELETKPESGFLAAGNEMDQLVNPFSSMLTLQSTSFQPGFFKGQEHPLKLSELPPILHNERHQSSDPSAEADPLVESSNMSLENEKIQYVQNGELSVHPALNGELILPTRSVQSEELPRSKSQEFHDSDNDSLNEEKDMNQPEISSTVQLASEKDMIQAEISSTVQLASDSNKHNDVSGDYGAYLKLSEPSSTSVVEITHPGYLAMMKDDKFTLYGAQWTVEDSRPTIRPLSVRNLPRNPLMEAVAAHDRNTLRKVSELVQPSDKQKTEQRNLLLEQIRNKAFSLKPVVVPTQNIKGPRTNIKVAAILEKANAIRQACAGSDEDDDGDSWSDS